MRSSGCLSDWDKRLKSSVSEVVFFWLEIIVEVDDNFKFDFLFEYIQFEPHDGG